MYVPFYEKFHEYKFDDFNISDDMNIAFTKYTNQDTVNLLQLTGNHTELKNKSFQNVFPSKKLEYFNKAKEVELALKYKRIKSRRQDEIKLIKRENNFPKAKTNEVYFRKNI